MSRIKSGEWIAPFWGKPLSLSGGRDPLGMQNASTATYATLLPGLTNLTKKIRYYGFYCWANNYYAANIRNDSRAEYNKFIRRAELLYAFANAILDENSAGIPGSDFVNGSRSGIAQSIDLAKGADIKDGKRTYWKYSSGAFGQYYLGSLLALGLLKQALDQESGTPLGIYICTESGSALGEAFGAAVGKETESKFFRIVADGKTTVTEVKKLNEKIVASAISVDTRETELYLKLLLGPDASPQIEPQPTFFRRSTIKLFLDRLIELSDGGEVRYNDFPELIYKDIKRSNADSDLFRMGWFYYQLNEYSHIAVETFLWATLDRLEGDSHPIPIDTIISDLASDAVEAIYKLLKLRKKNALMSDLFASAKESKIGEFELVDQILDSVRSKNRNDAMARAILLIVTLYQGNHERSANIAIPLNRSGMRRSGDALELIETVEKMKQMELRHFLERFLLRSVINRHLFVATRKIGNGEKTTFKFILRDSRLQFMSLVEPSFTNPRLESLYLFLRDLNLIHDGSLTGLGRTILKEGT